MGNHTQALRAPNGMGLAVLRIAIAPALLLFCLTSAPAKPNRISHTRMKDIAYQPFLEKDGYVQAWNVNFHGNGYSIFLTYLISNMGPGRLNNGLSIVIRHGKKTRVGTAEFAEQSLKARRGRLDLKMGPHNSLLYKKGAYYIGAKINDTRLSLKLTPSGPGLRLSGGPMFVGGSKGDFLRADVPVVAGWARGTLHIDGKRIALNGAAGMEHILANRSPHKYANRFTLVRTVRAGKAVLLGGIHKSSGGYALNAAYMEKGRVLRSGPVRKYEVIKERRNSFSGYRIPLKAVYHLSGPGNCRVTETRLSYRGGYYILRQVSALLRFVLRVFFARPYILHYRSRVEFACDDFKRPGAKTVGLREVSDLKDTPAGKTPFRVTLPTITSYYLINR